MRRVLIVMALLLGGCDQRPSQEQVRLAHDQQLLDCYMAGYIWGKYEVLMSGLHQPAEPKMIEARDDMQRNCNVPAELNGGGP